MYLLGVCLEECLEEIWTLDLVQWINGAPCGVGVRTCATDQQRGSPSARSTCRPTRTCLIHAKRGRTISIFERAGIHGFVFCLFKSARAKKAPPKTVCRPVSSLFSSPSKYWATVYEIVVLLEPAWPIDQKTGGLGGIH